MRLGRLLGFFNPRAQMGQPARFFFASHLGRVVDPHGSDKKHGSPDDADIRVADFAASVRRPGGRSLPPLDYPG